MTNGIRTMNCLTKELKMSKGQDVDFGSAGEEEFFEDINSPTDNSEDSVEVKVSPISSRNKRKCTEPRKVPEKFTGPLKKRMCLKVKSELEKTSDNSAPFRPWSPKVKQVKTEADPKCVENVVKVEKNDDFRISSRFVVPPPIPILHQYYPNHEVPPSAYFRPPSPMKYPEEPVALIKKCPKTEIKKEPETLPSTSIQREPPRVPVHPQITQMTPVETERLILNTTEAFPSLKKSDAGKREQRNYKNMTRERRIEANARERTRVHTISAAFDTLRKSIPSYSHNQKLSKLSVLRIACSYIMTLSNIVQDDEPKNIAEGVEVITKTIQREGKLRKKKDDND